VNLLGDNGDTINENSETLIDASREIGLGIIIDKVDIVYVAGPSPECMSKS
jgi:hypothetical protein